MNYCFNELKGVPIRLMYQICHFGYPKTGQIEGKWHSSFNLVLKE